MTLMSRQPFARYLFTAALCLSVLLLLGSAAAPETGAPAKKAALPPFAVGEKLVYSVDWDPPWYLFFLPKMEAGEAEVRIDGETRYNGKKALRIVFEARSSGSLVRLAGLKVDDRYEFLTDPNTFCTFTVNKKIRQGKRKRDVSVVYLPEANRLHIREADAAQTPPKVQRDEFKNDVPACVQDLFSALYAIRTRELSVGDREVALVGDNDRIKEVEVRVEKRERVTAPAGNYQAWKLKTVALVGGLFREGGQFNLWLSADERRLPVQFEAKVNLGRVVGKIKSIE
jgi:hypothetical protein